MRACLSPSGSASSSCSSWWIVNRNLMASSSRTELPGRSHFDAAAAGQWDPRSHLDGFVQVPSLDQKEPVQLFCRFGEGAIGGGQLAVPTRTVVAVSTGCSAWATIRYPFEG